MEYAILIGSMLVTGLIGGILSGLLGVGGGIVVVPVLDLVLGFVGVDSSIRMHVAVATSLATIIPTSISSSRAHARRHSVDFDLVKRWSAALFLGAALGTVIAGQVHGRVLAGIFAVVAMAVAIKMVLPLDNRIIAQSVPRGLGTQILPSSIGMVSAMMGIGGGTLSVPILTLLNQSIHRAVGTASLFGLLISIPGTIGFIVAGFGSKLTPVGSLGYVNLIGFALIAPGTVLAAPVGAKIAHWLNKRHLSAVFGLFLLIASMRMFYQALHI